MPIYAYKCESCGFVKDVLQKMSDAPLEVCPSCAQPAFKKQLTAAGFQLKGSGWYVTDFKGGGAAPATTVAPAQGEAAAAPEAAKPASTETTAAPAVTPVAPASGTST
jgi:putative FmdB family regulatory protein